VATKNDMAMLADLMRNDRKRRALARDFSGTLKKEGVDESKLPAGVARVVKRLDSRQLKALSDANRLLDRAGVSDRYKSQLV
jgi:hypothetical protein